jgi:DNA sulfur modification protein DndB
MTNKTLIPALKARVGDWDYYICMMKYGAVAREIQFAFELGGNTDLNTLIQRGISERTHDIVKYLLTNEHRFLGALIVAAWGGDPQFTSVEMQDKDGLIRDLDDRFGVLTFDGSQQYFALDGQHRLRAIKDAIKQKPELSSEDVCVILVSHFDTAEGRERTRRLFSNINRNAKSTTRAENIALDEDDAFAIISRRMLNEHPLLRQAGRVIVFTHQGEAGEISLASGNVPKTDQRAFTTLGTLHEMVRELAFGLDPVLHNPHIRPPVETVDEGFLKLTERFDQLLSSCGDLRKKLEEAPDARMVRGPKGDEGSGHPFMRPLIQRSVSRVIKQLFDQTRCTFKSALDALRQLPWRIADAPWQAVAVVEDGTVRMRTQRDHVELLDALLRIHIAPHTRAEIKRARQDFQRLAGTTYPHSEDALAARLPADARRDQ